MVRDAARVLGYPDVPEIVTGTATALERGHSMALAAAPGSGAELLFAAAAITACDEAGRGVGALVVSPTPETAFRAAVAVRLLGGETGVATLGGSSHADSAGDDLPPAQVISGMPTELLTAVRAGHLATGGLRLLVVDGFAAFHASDSWPQVEALLVAAPDARKIITSDVVDASFASFADRQLSRARRWPPELFRPFEPGNEETANAVTGAEIGYVTAPDLLAGLPALGSALASAASGRHGARVRVIVSERGDAAFVASGLSALGLRIADPPGEEGVTVAGPADEPLVADVAGIVGLPLTAAQLAEWTDAPSTVALVRPGHLPQLRLLASRIGAVLSALPEPLPAAGREALARWRERIRGRAGQVPEGPALLALEPLLAELGGARLAATLASMVPTGDAATEAAPDRMEVEARSRRAATAPTWTRIYVDVGRLDDAGPADLVGAITGETDAVAGQIGKIDVRSRFTLVELDSLVADDVIAGLQGRSIKGRTVSPRLDRER